MSDFRLRVFAAAARTLNFKQAAQELCISQPAVSKHIKSLEDHYHVRLFERLGGRLCLSAAGRAMQQHCHKILQDYDALSYAMHLFNQETAGRLRLGASTTIAQYLLPRLLAEFTSLYPDIEISLLNSNTRGIEQALNAHEIELGLVEGAFKSAGLIYTPFMQDKLLVLAPADMNVPAHLNLPEFLQLPLVLREHGSGTLDVISLRLAALNLKLTELRVVMYLGSTEGIKQFLQHSHCLSIVSALAVEPELKRGELKVISVEGLNLLRELNLVQSPGTTAPLAERFCSFLLEKTAAKG